LVFQIKKHDLWPQYCHYLWNLLYVTHVIVIFTSFLFFGACYVKISQFGRWCCHYTFSPPFYTPSHILPSLISSFHLNNFSIIYSLLSFVSRPSFHNPSSSIHVISCIPSPFCHFHFTYFTSPFCLISSPFFNHHYQHFASIIICVHYLISPPLIITISRPLFILSFRVRYFINIIENHYSAF